MIPDLERVHQSRHSNNIPAIHVRQNYLKNSFISSSISDENQPDWQIRNSGSLTIF